MCKGSSRVGLLSHLKTDAIGLFLYGFSEYEDPLTVLANVMTTALPSLPVVRPVGSISGSELALFTLDPNGEV